MNELPDMLAAFVENSGGFVCLASLHGRPLYLNRAARRLLGLGDEEPIAAASLRDYYAEESWAELRDVAVPAVNEAGHWEGRSRVRHAQSGECVELRTSIFLVRRAKGEKANCLAIVHEDAAERDRLEAALAEAQARKHAILESALDPIITINHDGLITEFNRAAEQVFGHPRDKLLGQKPSEVLFPPSKSAGHQDRIDRYLDVGEGSMLGKRIEVVAMRANGEEFAAEMAMTISHEQGAPVLTFFVRDISLRKKAEQEQARYAAELERSNRELEQFAYVASHDLQEPLRKIQTFSDRLQMRCKERLDEEGQECVERMHHAAARMQVLIDGLLTLSRVTTKGQDFVHVDLAKIAREVVSDLEVQIAQAGGRVETGNLPTIQADPLQMRQLLQNLIGNALKFRRVDEPPVVRVSGRYVPGKEGRSTVRPGAGEQCRILVEDNGIGFEEKHAERIFGVFQRLHPRDVFAGTGIGLAICRRIVERHGGTIAARSTPGKGSAFEVLLPVAQTRKRKS
jgi:two-component system sensor kinase FixL